MLFTNRHYCRGEAICYPLIYVRGFNGTFFDLNGNAEYVRRTSTLSARLMHRVEKRKKKKARNLFKQINVQRNRSYIVSYLQSRVLIISTILPDYQSGISLFNYTTFHISVYLTDTPKNEHGNEGFSIN